MSSHRRRLLLLASAAGVIAIAGLRLWDGEWMARPYRLLVSSAAAGNTRVLQALLWLGLDPNREVVGRGFPLFAAAGAGQREVVALLLDRGADVNRRTKHGNTALQAALRAGHLDVARDLIARRADVEIPGEDGPPLLAAARLCQAQAVELLLHSGANPDTPSPLGTARDYSRRYGCNAVRAMLEENPVGRRQ